MKSKINLLIKYLIIALQILAEFALTPIKKKSVITKFKNFSNQKNLLLFVGYSSHFDFSTMNFLEAAKEMDCYVIYVNNNEKMNAANIPDTLIDVYINNQNKGWDFSLYKTGTKYICEGVKNKNFERVLYANDSVFYLKKGLHQFLKKFLDVNSDFVSTFENSGNGRYHYSSWIFSVKREIFFSEKYQKFFNNIYDIKNKFYSIHFGEHRFSKLMLSLTESIETIFSNEYLLRVMDKIKIENEFIKVFDSEPLRDFKRTCQPKYFNQENFNNWLKLNLWLCSPMHVFGVFLAKSGNLPVIKKDLYWTQWHHQYSSLGVVQEIVAECESTDVAIHVHNYYIRRGRLRDGTFTQKVQSRLGLRA